MLAATCGSRYKSRGRSVVLQALPNSSPTAHFAEDAAHLRYGLMDAMTVCAGWWTCSLMASRKRAVLGEKVPHGCQATPCDVV